MSGKYCQWSGRDTLHPRTQPNFHEKVPDRITHLWVFGALLLGYVIYIVQFAVLGMILRN